MLSKRVALAAVMIVVAVAAAADAQQDEAERERVERVADILVELGVRDGARIADLGSAGGFYTLRIAKAVAPTGRAYAVDIDAKVLDLLRERATEQQLTNIEIIVATPSDPRLPGDLDAVLIRNTYHEIPEYRRILDAIMAALKPDGRLIVVEAIHEKYRALPREQQVKEHEIAPELVERELREAGFAIVKRDDAFTTFTRPPPGGFWLIVARRPSNKS